MEPAPSESLHGSAAELVVVIDEEKFHLAGIKGVVRSDVSHGGTFSVNLSGSKPYRDHEPFWILGIEVAVQNAVGTEQYGFYYAIFNFSFLLNILLDFGITNFNNKNISQNNHLLSKHLSSIILLRLLLANPQCTVQMVSLCLKLNGLEF